MADDDFPAILGGAAIRSAGPPIWPAGSEEVAAILTELGKTGAWGQYEGECCRKLSRELAAFHSAEHVILCSSGTVGVELALRGLNLQPGDEVILSAYDFKANFMNIALLGATPVLIDVDSASCQMDPAHIASAISRKTKGILVSHLHGLAAPISRIKELADAHQLPVIEDACQIPGAILNGRRAGMNGAVGVLSFGGSKLLSAGRGGAVLTNRDDIAARIQRYQNRGNVAYPLSELQAAVVLPQLRELNQLRTIRARNASLLIEKLTCRSSEKSFAGFVPFSHRELPAVPEEPDYYNLGCFYDPAAFSGLPRELFCRALQAEGIAIDPGFRGLHQIHARGRFRAVGELANATMADERVVKLHHPILLEGETGVAEIMAAIEKICRHAGALLSASERLPSETPTP